MKRGRATLLLVTGLAVGFIVGWWIGSPGVVVRSFSPNGQRVAEVRPRFAIDPPAHSLWVRAEGKARPTRLVDLGADVDWCNTIVWSPDSERVAFLVRGLRLEIYSFETRKVSKIPLVEADGYPGSFEARQVAFGADGREITFRTCRRNSDQCDNGRAVVLKVDADATGRDAAGG